MKPAKSNWAMSLLKTLPVALLSAGFAVMAYFSYGGGSHYNPGLFLAALVLTWALLNAIFFLLVHTKKTDRYRAVLFILYAVFFSIGFIADNVAARGAMYFTQLDVARCEIPFCHIGTTMMLLPMVFTKSLIFPGSLSAILSMVIISIMAALVLGRGFCGYVCFYGGLEDGCSRISKKPLIKKIDPKWALLPFAVLIVVALTSFAALSPTYCFWACPFKAVTEYEKIVNPLVLIQTIIFLVLFVGLVVVLPILTRKRTQCSFLCPFGAMMSLSNPINPFTIRIDTEKCVKCRRCVTVCPTFSLTDDSLETGKPRINCTKCGKCVDACSRGAIHYHIRGTRPDRGHETKRLVFLYAAYIFFTVFGAPMVTNGIYRILHLIVTGSFI